MRSSVLLLSFCFAGAAFLMDKTRCDEPLREAAQVAPSTAEIEQWIADLNAPEFSRRETATRRLMQIGPSVADDLVAAAQSGPLEVTVRATAILRCWFTSDRDELVEAADLAFEKLSQAKNRHAATRAVAVLEQYAVSIRQPRALAQIQKLGGQIERLERGRPRGFVPDDSEPFYIILGRDWRGGEEGLKHVRRITSLSVLYLQRDRTTGKIVTPGLSNEAVEELKRARPDLAIQYRGRAFLGVSGDTFATGCRVATLKADSPADKAQLQPDDVITQFGGQPVRTFDELVNLIAEKQPGDVVKMQILRGDPQDILTLEQLQSRKDPGPVKDIIEQLRKRLSREVSVTLGEWGGK